MAKKIVTLGEIMLRLSTKNFVRLVQAEAFDAVYGGSEANVAVSLANYGHAAYFVSSVPDNGIGQAAINSLRRYGVHTDYIQKTDGRLGIYFLETGAGVRPSTVLYDRGESAIAQCTPQDFDFDSIFEHADWFHLTGITPALSPSAAELARTALMAAKRKGITVSIDLNFRKKLWTSEQAIKTMTPLMQYVDVCIGNEEDAKQCLGFTPQDTDAAAGVLILESYKRMFEQMKKQFNFSYIAASLRESHSASDNDWSALLYDGQTFYESTKYHLRIVDRVGAGDAFAAGLIHGLLTNTHPQDALEFATAASALKQTIPGDANHAGITEIQALSQGARVGRIQR